MRVVEPFIAHTPVSVHEKGLVSVESSCRDPCPDILTKIDHIKEQRIHQLAHDILAQALGLKLRFHQTDEPSADRTTGMVNMSGFQDERPWTLS